MLKNILKKYTPQLYVQIWENRIKVTNINTGNIYDEKPLIAIETDEKGNKKILEFGNNAASQSGRQVEIINPFSHPRVLFSDFESGEKLLQHILFLLLGNKRLSSSPVVVIHPMEKIEGGLTMIEKRALSELGAGAGAGAREIVVYQGKELSIHKFDFWELESNDKKSIDKSAKSSFFLIIVVILIIIGILVIKRS